MTVPRRYAVVGGGMSGMAATHFLRRAGCEVDVFERDEGLGGRSQSGTLEDKRVTFGGKNIGRRYRLFREFAGSLDHVDYEPFGINSSPIVDGRLRTFDSRRKIRGMSRFARQMTPRDAARFAAFALRVRANEENRFLGSRYFAGVAARRDGQALAAYFSRRFAGSVLRPMTVRMNGAEPDEVWPGNFGTNLGMLLDSYDQLTNGIGPLVDDFAGRYSVHTGATVESLAVDEAGRVCGLRVAGGDDGPWSRGYDGVVLAVPAVAASGLVRPLDDTLATTLAAVCYHPAAVVLATYERPVFPEEVRGVVFPAGEVVSNAGAYGVDERHVVRYTFSGRAAREHLGPSVDSERLLRLAEEQLGRHMPVGQAGRREFVSRSWAQAYCAYLPRHDRFRAEVAGRTRTLPGLHLTGDYLRGASIEACFRAARDCVEGLLAERSRKASTASVQEVGAGAAP